jgi:acyl-CoA thioesterase FadM
MLLRIPRHACSPRDACRAGDLWRLVQEVAVRDSAARGWPPSRYRASGTGFVVRAITGVHHREARYDEEIHAETWITDIRRGVLMRRETRFAGVLDASVEWVHVGADGGLSRAPAELLAAFQPRLDGGPGARLPEWTPEPPLALPSFPLRPWWTEMDPLGHTNHPRYVDWAEEALSCWLAGRGADPLGLVPVADHIRYLSAARAGDAIRVEATRVGSVGDAAVFTMHVVRDGGGPLPGAPREHSHAVCEVTLVRRHLDGPGVLA